MIVLYSVAISEEKIFIKNPFDVKQGMLYVHNDRGLLNGIVECKQMPIPQLNPNIIIISDLTKRINLRQNKNKTSYLLDKQSIKRQECLYIIEKNKRLLNEEIVVDPMKNYDDIPKEIIEIIIVET